jgi:carbamoyltransferase
VSLWAGIGGAARNACVALCTRDEVVGICEQERITRVRAAGVNATGLPDEALDELLKRAGRARSDLTGVALAEETIAPAPPGAVRLEHHFAHACAAFLPSPFEAARIVICDHDSPEVSVWDGNGRSVTRVDRPWHGTGFAELYSQCAEVVGFGGSGGEQRMEALARLAPSCRDERVTQLFDLAEDRLVIAPDWRARVESWIGAGAPIERVAGFASALQSRIGELLVSYVKSVAGGTAARRLCVGGDLFYNSDFNTRVKLASAFEDTFVPINPGNAGLALGTAMHASEHARRTVGPFLGPAYSPEETKATLDNCKLTYDWASESETIEIAVDALKKGQLVAWFDGAMEWGPRALGARSILANPFSPYVLENLNRFLKHRDKWRGYALSVPDRVAAEHFDGPRSSPFMECDYAPKDRSAFSQILPGEQASVRVQTVGEEAAPRFRAVLQAFGEAAGIPILVNTSFNGFREPIVCTPRDAVRVFYGTGINVLVFPQFVIRK